MKVIPLLFIILVSCKSAFVPQKPVAPTEWHTLDIPLIVTIDTLASEPLLDRFIHSMGTIGNTLVLVENRAVWMKKSNQPPVPLDVNWADADWFGHVCDLENGLVISVGSYPEDRRLKEAQAPRGSFVAGPVPLGWLHIRGEDAAVRSIDSLQFLNGKRVPPVIQSCQATNSGMYVGFNGGLAHVDLQRLDAVMIEQDEELPYNRNAILIEEHERWVMLDEGGLSAAYLEHTLTDTLFAHLILGISHHELLPDGIVRFKGDIYTSSLAGIVKIEEDLKRFTHYQLSQNPTEMRVYGVQTRSNHLLGTREDGWIRLSPATAKATLYRLEEGLSNNVYDIAELSDSLVIATEDGARILKKTSEPLQARMPEPIGGMQAVYARVDYPEEARRMRIQGQVVVGFILDETGRALNPKVIRGIGGGCDEAAVRAIMQSQFTPALDSDGTPIPSTMHVAIIFRLQN